MELKNDVKVYKIIRAEQEREKESIELIASENYASKAVREAAGCVFTNKYSEGKPHKRYYAGQKNVDEIEDLAVERALRMFKLSPRRWHVNIQPYSGSPANLEVYFAFLEFGDRVMGMKLDEGGHLTHGHFVNFSGRAYNFVQYPVDHKTGRLDYDYIEKMAVREKPKMIVCGATAYSRIINFRKFRMIANKVGAILFADISHIAGLIVGGVHPSCFPWSDVMMTTTHKTLRGPRGAIIICKDKYAKQVDKAVFPGMQGGPHDNVTAAKAVAFGEALKPSFKKYARQIVKNAKTLASQLKEYGFEVISGGTDNHLMLVDLRPANINGKNAQLALESANIIVNKNTIPGDPEKPMIGSGIRIGTPAVTTREMKEKQMKIIAKLMNDVLRNPTDEKVIRKTKQETKKLALKFPVP